MDCRAIAAIRPLPQHLCRRRECLGKLIQMDGSKLASFEDRGKTGIVLARLDDAPRCLMRRPFGAPLHITSAQPAHVWWRMPSPLPFLTVH